MPTTFRLIEHPSQGFDQRIRAHGNQQSPGDVLLAEKPLFDPVSGAQRGSFVFRGTVIQVFGNDALVSFEASNMLTGQGVINTQGAIRFSDIGSANGATFAIVGGTNQYRDARGTVTAKTTGADTTEYTFNVLP
jgi:hypothetical protein